MLPLASVLVIRAVAVVIAADSLGTPAVASRILLSRYITPLSQAPRFQDRRVGLARSAMVP